MLAMIVLAEGGSNIIKPNFSLVIILVLFVIFVFLMSRLLFKPIGRVLDERELLTEGATAEARAASRHYKSRLADYEASMRQARAESYRQLEERRALALEERNRLIEQVREQAAVDIERAKEEIRQQTSQARAALEVESRQIAERISRTLLGRAVGGAD